MKPPIIVYDSGDVLVYESVEHIYRHIGSEPELVNGNERTFDGEGRLLKLDVIDDQVTVREIEPFVDATAELREILIDFLDWALSRTRQSLWDWLMRRKPPQPDRVSREWLMNASLEVLVSMAFEYRVA